jgi:hypothetical protein
VCTEETIMPPPPSGLVGGTWFHSWSVHLLSSRGVCVCIFSFLPSECRSSTRNARFKVFTGMKIKIIVFLEQCGRIPLIWRLVLLPSSGWSGACRGSVRRRTVPSGPIGSSGENVLFSGPLMGEQ